MTTITALIADDEPLLRERLVSLLNRPWPELQIVARARNGRVAVELFDQHLPSIAFLDVHMPGLNGIETARCIVRRAEVVFITAHENYAVEAFKQGAIDYVVKPIDEDRLADTVERLRNRMERPAAALQPDMAATLDQLAAQLRERVGPRTQLQWIKASVGNAVRLIPVDQVIYLKSDTKYTLVVWEGWSVAHRLNDADNSTKRKNSARWPKRSAPRESRANARILSGAKSSIKLLPRNHCPQPATASANLRSVSTLAIAGTFEGLCTGNSTRLLTDWPGSL